jgi:hypothetical protein
MTDFQYTDCSDCSGEIVARLFRGGDGFEDCYAWPNQCPYCKTNDFLGDHRHPKTERKILTLTSNGDSKMYEYQPVTVISHRELPKEAYDTIGKIQLNYIDEMRFQRLSNGLIEAIYGGECLAIWNGKGWY